MTVAQVILLFSLALQPPLPEDGLPSAAGKPLLIIAEDVEGEALLQVLNRGIVLDVRPRIDNVSEGAFMAVWDTTGRVDMALLRAAMDSFGFDDGWWFLDFKH